MRAFRLNEAMGEKNDYSNNLLRGKPERTGSFHSVDLFSGKKSHK
jgi:hypothetical protein